MKFIVLLFGTAGFTLVMLSGLVAGRSPDLVLRDAALACLGAAFLGRWFGGVIREAFTQALAIRRAAQESAAAAVPAMPAPAPITASIPARARPAPAAPSGGMAVPVPVRGR